MLALLASWIAWRIGFYTYPNSAYQHHLPTKAYLLPLRNLAFIFLIFFALQSLIFPLLVYVAYKGAGINVEMKSIPSDVQAWMNVIGMLLTAPTIWLFARFLDPNYFRYLMGSQSWKNLKMSIPMNIAFGIRTWFVAFPLMLAFSLLLGIIIESLFHPPAVDQLAVHNFKSTFGSPWQFWLTLIGITLTVPAAEEMLFRGFFQGWFRQRIGSFPAILLTSLIFALMHYSSEHGWHNLQLLPSLFLLSCFLGYLFERQQSLWAPIGLHAIFNLVSVCMILIEGEGAHVSS